METEQDGGGDEEEEEDDEVAKKIGFREGKKKAKRVLNTIGILDDDLSVKNHKMNMNIQFVVNFRKKFPKRGKNHMKLAGCQGTSRTNRIRSSANTIPFTISMYHPNRVVITC
uniref:Uncharacterized protein n=1 Tax=Caenorhabditis japonica TaxID=281687 RepID=A0A8R1EET4_CAEJA